MNQEETAFEQKIRDSISKKEEWSAEITRTAIIEKAKISIKIAKDAARSQDQETLSKGLDHCAIFQAEMGFSEIGHKIEYSEAGSSEEEIRSLENKIISKLSPATVINKLFDAFSSPVSSPYTIILIKMITREEDLKQK